MNDDQIVDYLLGALEAPEAAEVEQKIQSDPELAQRAESHRHRLSRWSAAFDEGVCDEMPVGLARRTCESIWEPTTRVFGLDAPSWTSRTWGLADALVAVAVSLCGLLLVFPAVSNSRYQARREQCMAHLGVFGAGFGSYSDANSHLFPQIPTQGRAAVAGAVAATLLEEGWVSDAGVRICPGDVELMGSGEPLPTLADLAQASPATLPHCQQLLGGSYAYPLGVASSGRWRAVRDRQRPYFALMSDAPRWNAKTGDVTLADFHDRLGQNVLFEDLSVRFVTGPYVGRDHLNLNSQMRMAAGTHEDDSVIAPSGISPAGGYWHP